MNVSLDSLTAGKLLFEKIWENFKILQLYIIVEITKLLEKNNVNKINYFFSNN